MGSHLQRIVVGGALLGIGVLIGSVGQTGFERRADAQVKRVGARPGGPVSPGSVSSPGAGEYFPVVIYKGPGRTVDYYSAGRQCKSLNVAEVLVYPGLMVFKDHRGVIGGTGLAALGQFSIIVGQ